MIRLQAVYSALAMGGGIAVMTVIAGFLFEHWRGGVFWVMAAVAVPALVHPAAGGQRQPLIKGLPAARGSRAAGFPAAVRYRISGGCGSLCTAA